MSEFKYGDRSLKHRATLHPDLQVIFDKVLKTRDHSIVAGHRGEAEQNAAFNAKRSQLRFPESKHNQMPSMAVDVYPYPLDFTRLNRADECLNRHQPVDRRDLDEWRRMDQFIGYVLATADQLLASGQISHRLFSGSDWNGDSILSDQKFHDLPHFELRAVVL